MRIFFSWYLTMAEAYLGEDADKIENALVAFPEMKNRKRFWIIIALLIAFWVVGLNVAAPDITIEDIVIEDIAEDVEVEDIPYSEDVVDIVQDVMPDGKG